jgi:putative hydrolase of the HAD superfamily
VSGYEWVIFDYGGVLCRTQPDGDRAAIEQAAGTTGGDDFWAAYWRHRPAYDRAELATHEYWSEVLGAPPDPDRTEALHAADVASWLHPWPESLAVVDELVRSGVRVALLSNAPAGLADAVDQLQWMQRIPRRYYSSRLGATKPSATVYEQVLAELGAPPHAVAFVDDRPDNVDAATSAGMRAIHFRDPAKLAHDLGVRPTSVPHDQDDPVRGASGPTRTEDAR